MMTPNCHTTLQSAIVSLPLVQEFTYVTRKLRFPMKPSHNFCFLQPNARLASPTIARRSHYRLVIMSHGIDYQLLARLSSVLSARHGASRRPFHLAPPEIPRPVQSGVVRQAGSRRFGLVEIGDGSETHCFGLQARVDLGVNGTIDHLLQ